MSVESFGAAAGLPPNRDPAIEGRSRRRIAEAAHRTDKQRGRVARLRATDRPPEVAERLLAAFEDTLHQLRRSHRLRFHAL